MAVYEFTELLDAVFGARKRKKVDRKVRKARDVRDVAEELRGLVEIVLRVHNSHGGGKVKFGKRLRMLVNKRGDARFEHVLVVCRVINREQAHRQFFE